MIFTSEMNRKHFKNPYKFAHWWKMEVKYLDILVRLQTSWFLSVSLCFVSILVGLFLTLLCWLVTVAAKVQFCLFPESCEPSSVCQEARSSHDESPVDTIPGSRPNEVPSYAPINLIPIYLQNCALLCHLCLFC